MANPNVTTDGKYTFKTDIEYLDGYGYRTVYYLEDAQGNRYGLEKVKEWNLKFPDPEDDDEDDEEPLTDEERWEIECDKRYHEMRDMWIEEK